MFIKNIITILPLLPANIGFVKRFSNSELHIFLFLYADFSLFYILYHKKGLPVMDNPFELIYVLRLPPAWVTHLGILKIEVCKLKLALS